MRSSIPGWLKAALDQALVEAGATAPPQRRRELVDRLISAWNLDGRRFHNFRYLAYVFERLDELEGATSEPELLRLAAAFRGALDELGWEETTPVPSPAAVPAMVSVKDLTDLGIPQPQAQRIETLITQLSRHDPRHDDLGARILVDADLAAFAAPPQQYREFLQQLRLESANLSEVEFLRARKAVLCNLLRRSQIFSTPVASQWEDAARENLEAELTATKRKLARLDGADEGDDAAPEMLGTGEDAPEDLAEQIERPVKNDRRVLRISRAQKLRRLEADQASDDGDGTEGTAQAQASAGTASRKLPPAEQPPVEDYTTDTSTLESAVDLIESRRARARTNATGTIPKVTKPRLSTDR